MSHHIIFELLSPCQTAWWIEQEVNREKLNGELVCSRGLHAVTDRRSIFTDTPLPKTAFISEWTNSPHCKGNVQPTHYNTHSHRQKYVHFVLPRSPLASLLHSKTLRPETKTQVKVNKRCLWIFWVTNSDRCLHSPCNYLLTDLILAVKCLAKSMCTQTGPGRKVVHAIYLPGPSHTYTHQQAWQESYSIWPYGRWTSEKIMYDCSHAYTLKQTRWIHVAW